MTRPKEKDYTSQVAYTRALEAYCDSLPQLTQQEPVAWMQNTTAGLYVIDHYDEWHCIPLYTSPPAQRKPLTPEWYAQWIRNNYQDHPNIASLCDAITKAAHGIKE